MKRRRSIKRASETAEGKKSSLFYFSRYGERVGVFGRVQRKEGRGYCWLGKDGDKGLAETDTGLSILECLLNCEMLHGHV